MDILFSYEIILSFITLTFLEIILGIDNLIFITIAVHNLPTYYRRKARYIGISLALIIRVLMLFTLSWVMSLTKTLFVAFGIEFSANHLLLLAGGIFLIVKSSLEIYSDITNRPKNNYEENNKKKIKNGFFKAVMQVIIVDFIFSFDSIITAIGMSKNLAVIISAVIVSMIVMLFASDYLAKLLHKYPSLKIMALAFIFLVGVILFADGVSAPISKGYLYFALFFSLGVEFLNIIANNNRINKLNT